MQRAKSETSTMVGMLKMGAPADAGQRIRAWRLRSGLTQEELARALSVTFASVSRWENGHVVPSKLAWRALRDLAAQVGTPLDTGAAVSEVA
jgi:transcriptional regulator with XRE-family HTH domain